MKATCFENHMEQAQSKLFKKIEWQMMLECQIETTKHAPTIAAKKGHVTAHAYTTELQTKAQ